MAAKLRGQRHAVGVVHDLPDGVDRHVHPAQGADQPGPVHLPGLVAAIAGSGVNERWPEQAELVVMPQGVDRQAADQREPTDAEPLVGSHTARMVSRATRESTLAGRIRRTVGPG